VVETVKRRFVDARVVETPEAKKVDISVEMMAEDHGYALVTPIEDVFESIMAMSKGMIVDVRITGEEGGH
jgi:hypothetical protein